MRPIPRERVWGAPLVRIWIEAQFALQRQSDAMAVLHECARLLGEPVPDIPRERALVPVRPLPFELWVREYLGVELDNSDIETILRRPS